MRMVKQTVSKETSDKLKKQKYGKERYRCEVTDGNQKEDLYITIPEVKTLSEIKKVNGEVYKSGMEGIFYDGNK